MKKWFVKNARNVWRKNSLTIYRDIFEEGVEEPIAERVLFTEADRIVHRHNGCGDDERFFLA